MKFVTWYGHVYRLTNRNYVSLLRAIAEEQPYELERLGHHVAVLDQDVTDMSAENAKDLIDYLKPQKEKT